MQFGTHTASIVHRQRERGVRCIVPKLSSIEMAAETSSGSGASAFIVALEKRMRFMYHFTRI